VELEHVSAPMTAFESRMRRVDRPQQAGERRSLPIRIPSPHHPVFRNPAAIPLIDK
jgi:hypothetical protein